MKNIVKRIITVMLVLQVANCAVNTKNVKQATVKPLNQIPPGVDSLLAVKADSMANLFFVDFTQKMKSNYYYDQSKKLYDLTDSLWHISQQFNDTLNFMTELDSAIINRLYEKCQDQLKKQDKRKNKQSSSFPDSKKIKNTCLELSRKAKDIAFNARFTNPFNLNARLNLVQSLILLGKITEEKDYYRYAIRELHDFLYFEKSKDKIFALLAESNYAIGSWKNAYDNFYKAQQVLEKTVIFSGNTMELDTTKLVYYLQQQGDCKAKLYDDKSALQLLHQALDLTRSPQKIIEIENYIKWINWDDGNILAVEKRDFIFDLYYKKKYKKANNEFKKLLKILKTQRTKNFINWKIATIDFEILNRKNDGVKRLFKVIINLPKESLNDSTSLFYLTDYGAMCFTLGNEYLQKKKNKIAYAYFKQAAQINWEKCGECYFQLARLSQSDSNETIKNCQRVLNFKEYLTEHVINQTYELLVDAYKRNGNFKLARQYYSMLSQSSF